MRLRRPQFASYRACEALTIRWATPGDGPELQALAELDEASVPPAPVLLGLVGNELWAAVSLSSREVVADPFKPSAEVASLVIERGRQLTVTQPRHRRKERHVVRRHIPSPERNSRPPRAQAARET